MAGTVSAIAVTIASAINAWDTTREKRSTTRTVGVLEQNVGSLLGGLKSVKNELENIKRVLREILGAEITEIM
mgnify:CR=1 FL=1